MKKVILYSFYFFIFVILTILTQIGGLAFLLCLLVNKKVLRLPIFISLYLLATFLLVPKIAPIFGRVQTPDTENISSLSILMKLLNRSYVSLELRDTLLAIGENIANTEPEISITLLDANFPFMNGFPLIPHLSHSDGKKIDFSLIYEGQDGLILNEKPSRSGYGVFSEPISIEENTTGFCKSNGYWQYDYSKYLSFGTVNESLDFSIAGNRLLLEAILKESNVSKLFLEPHLVKRIGIEDSRIRFHGCGAVRHDDHIHIQI